MKARPTIYNGIEMRSRLEARWAHIFDRLGWDWTYETHAYGTNYTSDQYLPDFRVTDRNFLTFIEIKPPIDDDKILVARRKMEIIWASYPGAELWIIQGDPEWYRIDAVSPPLSDAEATDPILLAHAGWQTIDTDPEKWDDVA